MTVYYVLYLILAVMAFLFFLEKKNATSSRSDQSGHALNVNWICFCCILLLLVLRSDSMGIDLQSESGYLNYFKYISQADLKTLLGPADMMTTRLELGFRFYVKALTLIWNNFNFFLAVTAFLSLFPIAFLIERKSTNPVLSWVIYLSTMPFLLLYSGLRQGLTIGIGAVLYLLAEGKRIVPYILLCIFAITMHDSSFLLFLIYPLVNIRIGIRTRILGIALLVPVLIFKDQIVSIAKELLPNYAYMFPEGSGGSYRYFAVLMMVYIVCCIFTDNSNFQNSYMNLFFVACAIQLLGLFSDNATRAGYYFVIALCPLLPDIIENIKNRKLALMIGLGSAVCFAVFGLYCIYTTYWAMAYPYHWFWEQVI